MNWNAEQAVVAVMPRAVETTWDSVEKNDMCSDIDELVAQSKELGDTLVLKVAEIEGFDGSPEDTTDPNSRIYTLWEANTRKEKISR
nr:hypothetical protein [Tanacetum cinerariifolium]